MSNFLFGDILLKTEPDLVQLAGYIYAHKPKRLYVKFGGNVSNQYFKTAICDNMCLCYEITDSILDNTADDLLSPEECAVDSNLRSWRERMDDIVCFAQSVLSLELVDAMTINFNVHDSFEAHKYSYECNLCNLLAILRVVLSEDREFLDPCASIYVRL